MKINTIFIPVINKILKIGKKDSSLYQYIQSFPTEIILDLLIKYKSIILEKYSSENPYDIDYEVHDLWNEINIPLIYLVIDDIFIIRIMGLVPKINLLFKTAISQGIIKESELYGYHYIINPENIKIPYNPLLYHNRINYRSELEYETGSVITDKKITLNLQIKPEFFYMYVPYGHIKYMVDLMESLSNLRSSFPELYIKNKEEYKRREKIFSLNFIENKYSLVDGLRDYAYHLAFQGGEDDELNYRRNYNNIGFYNASLYRKTYNTDIYLIDHKTIISFDLIDLDTARRIYVRFFDDDYRVHTRDVLIRKICRKNLERLDTTLEKYKDPNGMVKKEYYYKFSEWLSDPLGIFHLFIKEKNGYIQVPKKYIDVKSYNTIKREASNSKVMGYYIHISQRLGIWAYGMIFKDIESITNYIDSYIS